MSPMHLNRPLSAPCKRPPSSQRPSTLPAEGAEADSFSTPKTGTALEWITGKSVVPLAGKLQGQRTYEGGLLQNKAKEALRRWEKAARKDRLGPDEAVTGGRINFQRLNARPQSAGIAKRKADKENAAEKQVPAKLAGHGDAHAKASPKVQEEGALGSVEKEGNLFSGYEVMGLEGKPNKMSVVIHVYDDARKVNRDFKCELDTLLTEMQYFRQHLSGVAVGQPVEITVHCDVAVFGWLLRYAKHEERPPVSLQTCLPVLISSDFLIMQRLVQECIQYVASHIKEVAAMPLDLCCLSPSLLQQLAAELMESDLEDLFCGWTGATPVFQSPGMNEHQGKQALESQTFCKPALACKLYKLKLERLLQASEVAAAPGGDENLRGAAAVAPLSLCVNCGELYLSTAPLRLLCVKAKLFVDFRGQASASHVALKSWDLYRHLNGLRKKGHNWRGVYWHVWGALHVLSCRSCGAPFSAKQINRCRYHPGTPVFVPGDNRGAFPCCGQPALRFNTMELNLHQGCCARHHDPDPRSMIGGAVQQAQEGQQAGNRVVATIHKHAAALAAPFALQVLASNEGEAGLGKVTDSEDVLKHPRGGGRPGGVVDGGDEDDDWEDVGEKAGTSGRDPGLEEQTWHRTSLQEASIPGGQEVLCQLRSLYRRWSAASLPRGKKASSGTGKGSPWKGRKGGERSAGSLYKGEWEDGGHNPRRQRAFMQGLRRDDDAQRMEALAARLSACRAREEGAEKHRKMGGIDGLKGDCHLGKAASSSRKGQRPMSAQARGLLSAYRAPSHRPGKQTRPLSAPRTTFAG